MEIPIVKTSGVKISTHLGERLGVLVLADIGAEAYDDQEEDHEQEAEHPDHGPVGTCTREFNPIQCRALTDMKVSFKRRGTMQEAMYVISMPQTVLCGYRND